MFINVEIRDSQDLLCHSAMVKPMELQDFILPYKGLRIIIIGTTNDNELNFQNPEQRGVE